MLNELLLFAKQPVYMRDANTSITHKLRTFVKLLVLALCASIILLIIASVVENIFHLDDLFENYTVMMIFFLAVIIAPFFEELFFRGPLVFFKNSKFFKIAFYLFTVLFGFMHISNFEMTKQVLLFSPLLVAPQISVGFLLGYIRVRFGLIWSMALHACYNMVLIVPVLIMQLLDIPIE